MLNVIKLIVLAYLSFMGLIVTFGVIWMQFGLALTHKAVRLLAGLSVIVGVPYILWMVR